MSVQDNWQSDASDEIFTSDEEVVDMRNAKKCRPRSESMELEDSSSKRLKMDLDNNKKHFSVKGNYKTRNNINVLHNNDLDIPKENICNNKTQNVISLNNNINGADNNDASFNNKILDSSNNLNVANDSTNGDILDHLEVGDIIWSKLNGYPYWPAMISVDPLKKTIYKDTKMLLKKTKVVYHVQYFGTTPEHGWTRPCGILEYKGVDQFHKLVKDLIVAAPTSTAKKQVQLKYKIPSNRLETWKKAVDCSERGLKLSPEQRLQGLMRDDHKLFGIIGFIDFVPKNSEASVTKLNNKIPRKEYRKLLPKNSAPPKTVPPLIVKIPSLTPIKKNTNNNILKDVYKEFESEAIGDDELAAIFNSIPIPKQEELSTVDITPHPLQQVDSKSENKEIDIENNKEGKQLEIKIATKTNNSSVPVKSNSESGDSIKSGVSSVSLPGKKKKARADKFCVKCEKQNGELVLCKGKCNRLFHNSCLQCEEAGLICEDCKTNQFECIVCLKKDDFENLNICKQEDCTMFFHAACMSLYIPQYNMHYPEGQCPQHFCITCVYSKTRLPPYSRKNKFTRCLRCPHAYHKGFCVPAGSLQKTANFIICPDHLEKKIIADKKHNANWCFMCLTRKGDLKQCSTCPASFHKECYPGIIYDNDGFRCQNCKWGIQPKYGDKVWICIADYVWWPCKVIKPSSIPSEIRLLPHQDGEFVVALYSSKSFLWTDHRFVFHFEETLENKRNYVMPYKKYQKLYRQAITEALEDDDSDSDSEETLDEDDDGDFIPRKPRYKPIKFSKPFGDFQLNPVNLKDINVCDCTASDENPCLDDIECWNRNLKYECNLNLCKAGEKCKNQRFQKCEYPSLEAFKTSRRGWGLKTLEDLKKHQFVIEYVGDLITEEECIRRMNESHEKNEINFYFLTIDKDNIIDAGPKGNLSRFLNHSCDPNLETQKWEVNCNTRIGLFAKENIPAGTELTFNYMLKSMGETRAKCECKSSNCTGFIGSIPKVSNSTNKGVLSKKETNSPMPSSRQKRTPMIPRRFSDCVTSLPHLPTSPVETSQN